MSKPQPKVEYITASLNNILRHWKAQYVTNRPNERVIASEVVAIDHAADVVVFRLITEKQKDTPNEA